MRVPPRNSRNMDRPYMPQVGAFAISGLPGYTGFVPGMVSENVHGLTFQNANERATAEAHMLRKTGMLPRSYKGRTWEGPTAGQEVPGYMGFCPGRHADNVFGTTQTRGAEMSHLIKQQQMAERHHRVQCYRNGQRPATGTFDHAGYHPQASGPHHLDTQFVD